MRHRYTKRDYGSRFAILLAALALAASLPMRTSADTPARKPAAAAASRPATGALQVRPEVAVGKTPAQDKKGAAVPEFKPRRWSLSPGASQRKDWLLPKERFDWPREFNAANTLGLPEWLSASLEFRARYEYLAVPFVKGQSGSQYQVPLQTVLWMEAHGAGFRAGFEFWDARQFGANVEHSINNTMVNVANFPQLYGAWSTSNLADTGLGFEAKAGRQTLDLGSRRLVARNAFRNTTNSFQGLLLRLLDPDRDFQIQAFASQPIVRLPEQKAALVDNDWAWDQGQSGTVFTGAFAQKGLPFEVLGELYLFYLGESSDNSLNRRLFTPGFRLFRGPRKGEWDFEGESIAQTGSRNDTAYNQTTSKGTKREMSVQAFYEHVQAGYTFDLPWDPRLVVQYDWASAGTNGDGTVSHSFDTLYGARRWEYGPTGIFGPFARNNINSPGTRLFVVPHRDLAAFVAYRAWWMADRKAPWVPANLVDPTGQSGDFMGQTVELSVRWDAHENAAFEAGWADLIKGNFARNAPGAPANHDNSNYFYVQTQLRF